MKLVIGRIGFIAVMALGLLSLTAAPVWPGGSNDEGPDDHQDNGPSYFGFVKDSSGKIITDAKVTAEIKGRGAVITRSDKLGTYKIPGFGKEVDPKNVIISCSKEGYRQIRTFKRTPPGKASVPAIEVECTLQRSAAQ
jgi:hypothetical protein